MATQDFYHDFTKLLNKFDFGCFNKSYIETCWDDDFTNVDVLQEFEEEFLPMSSNFNPTLDKLHDILYQVAQYSRWDEFWPMFRDISVTPRQLSTFLCCLVAKGFSALPAVTSRTLKITSCYLLLLSTPERNVYQMLSYTTFDRALNSLRNSMTILFNSEARRSDGGKRKKTRSEGPQKRKKGGKKNNNDGDDVYDAIEHGNNGDDDVDVNDGTDVASQNVVEIKLEVLEVVKALCMLSGSGNLDETCKDRIVEFAMEMVAMESIATPCPIDLYRTENPDDMCHISYKILHELVKSDLETLEKNSNLFTRICHKLLPYVSLSKCGQNVPHIFVVMRDNAVNFVRSIAEEDGEKVEMKVKNFIQHVCVSVVDRADHRTKASQGLLPLLFNISPRLMSNISTWLTERLSKSSKVPHRMFAVDVIAMMLDENCHFAVLGEESSKTHQDFVKTLIDRCSDSSPSVRAKSITSLSKFTSIMVENTSSMETTMTHHPSISTSVLSQNVTNVNLDNVTSCSAIHDRMLFRRNASRLESTSIIKQPYNHHSMRTVNLTASNNTINLPDNTGVISMLMRRCRDPKVAVRKAAVLTLTNVFLLEGCNFNLENLTSVSERCNDTSIAVRKQALQSLTDILQHMPTTEVQKEWLRRILYSSCDQDMGIQMKCFDLLNQIILKGLLSSSSRDYDDFGLAWKLMEMLAHPDNFDQQKFFSKVCDHWKSKGLVSDVIVEKMLDVIDHRDGSEVAWYLLTEFSSNSKVFDLNRIIAHWSKVSQDFEKRGYEKDVECSVFGWTLKIVANIDGNNESLSDELVLPVVDNLRRRLANFEHEVNDVSFLVGILSRMVVLTEGLEKKVSECFVKLFQNCKDFMNKCLSGYQIGESTLIRCIFTYGELVQVIDQELDEPSFHLLVKFIADKEQLHPFNPSQGSQIPLSQFRGKNCSPDVRIFVFLSLGKFCLSKLEFAKLCVPALVRELSISRDDRLKNNIIFVLGDLIIKYAIIVDPYINIISSHLQDSCPLIRKQTCLILTRLLQEDFLKWKETLFFRFLRGVIDDHPDVRETVIFTLKNIHGRRREGIFFLHFVETIFYLNNQENVLSIGPFHGNDANENVFQLAGNSNLEKRMEIYKFLLESMNDSQRFQATGKLVNEVVTSFMDGTIELNDNSSMVLKDALMCLSCQEIKLSLIERQSYHDNDVDDNVDLRTAVENTAKKQLITEVMRKTVMESTIPIAVALKQMLEKRRSPLLKDLMNYFVILTKDYKNEIKDVLKSDPKLEQEIEFYLRRLRLMEDDLNPRGQDHEGDGEEEDGRHVGDDRSATSERLSSEKSKGNCSIGIENRSRSNKKRTSIAAMETIRSVVSARHQRLLFNKSVI